MALLALRLKDRRDIFGERHGLRRISAKRWSGDRENGTYRQQTMHLPSSMRCAGDCKRQYVLDILG
jgi:hypothetical protein